MSRQPIRRYDVHTPEEALLYLASCQIATCEELAMKKSRGVNDYRRQLSIAQSFVDWIRDFKIEVDSGNRVADVLRLPSQSVAEFVKKYEPESER